MRLLSERLMSGLGSWAKGALLNDMKHMKLEILNSKFCLWYLHMLWRCGFMPFCRVCYQDN